jgi:SAM-dependent methyltransferase
VSTKLEADEQRRVAQWRGVFDLLYRRSGDKHEATFNIAGWQSIYGRDAIPPAVMAEWLDQAVQRILELEPRRLLEIGCGTGMILQRVAPSCEAYLGLDLSKESIAFLRGLHVESDRVRLLERPAHELDDLERGSFDTVVVNSVIQYFPSAEYLERVVGAAIDLLGGTGTLFLGDLRHLAFLAPMHADIALRQAKDDATTASLLAVARQKASIERELLLDPRYFVQLRNRFPSITAVEARLKTGVTVNELNKYRYDATLRVGGKKPSPYPPPIAGTLDALAETLRRERPPNARVADVKNVALAESFAAMRALENPHGTTAAEARASVDAETRSEAAITPHDWTVWARGLGYRCKLLWASASTEGAFDVVLERDDAPPIVLEGDAPTLAVAPSRYANTPLITPRAAPAT